MVERLSGESYNEWKFRLITDKVDKKIDLDWVEIRDLIGVECSSDHLRKIGQGIAEVYKYYNTNKENEYHVPEDYSHLPDDVIKKLEIQKERVKLSSEKNEINKWIRKQSRSELFQDKLIGAISRLDKLSVPEYHNRVTSSGYDDSILLIADMHYGKKFTVKGMLGEIINEYNISIFEQRLWDLLDRVIEVIEKENMKHINIVCLGDVIEGMLRNSQLQKLQLGTVDQVIGFSEFMANWLNELSRYVMIDYFSVLGNHAETRVLNSGRGEFPEENMERIVTWYLQTRLSENKNIKIHNDGNFIYRKIADVNVLFAHGQYEKNLEQSIKDYMVAYNLPVNLLITGHLHSTHTKTIGMTDQLDIQFVQCPSVMGVDDFSMRLKKSSKAGSKMLMLKSGYGIVTEHNFKLN